MTKDVKHATARPLSQIELIENPLTADGNLPLADGDLPHGPSLEPSVKPGITSKLVSCARRLEGILFMIAASVLLTVNGAIAKHLSGIPSGMMLNVFVYNCQLPLQGRLYLHRKSHKCLI